MRWTEIQEPPFDEDFPAALFFLRRLDFDVQVPQLPLRNGRGGFSHQAYAFGGFGESDHIPNTESAAENCQQPIKTQRDSSVRRRSVAKSIKHIAKSQPGFFRRNLQHFLEHRLLKVRLVN